MGLIDYTQKGIAEGMQRKVMELMRDHEWVEARLVRPSRGLLG